jgi:hypothetical protein
MVTPFSVLNVRMADDSGKIRSEVVHFSTTAVSVNLAVPERLLALSMVSRL